MFMFDVDIEKCRFSMVYVYTHCQKCGEQIRGENFCPNCGTKSIKFDSIVFRTLKDAEDRLTTRKLKKAGFVTLHSPNSGKPIHGGRRVSCFLYCKECEHAVSQANFKGRTLHYCPHCGTKFGLPCHNEAVDILFTDEELKDFILEAFYNKHPGLRPKQEQKYLFSVAVYRKWNSTENFANSPFIFLSEQYTKDEIHGIADLNEEVFDRDDEATMLVDSEVGAFFKDCIENRWLYEDFREEKVVEKTCSLGDNHEFLIIVSINEVK